MGSSSSQPAAKYAEAPPTKAQILQGKRAALLDGGSVNKETVTSYAVWPAIKVSWDHHNAKKGLTETSMRELFSKFGEVHHVRLSRRGMAVVKFHEQASADAAASTKMPSGFRYLTVVLKEQSQISPTEGQGGQSARQTQSGYTSKTLGLTFKDSMEHTLFEKWQDIISDKEKLSLLHHTLSNQPVVMEDLESNPNQTHDHREDGKYHLALHTERNKVKRTLRMILKRPELNGQWNELQTDSAAKVLKLNSRADAR